MFINKFKFKILINQTIEFFFKRFVILELNHPCELFKLSFLITSCCCINSILFPVLRCKQAGKGADEWQINKKVETGRIIHRAF